MQEANGGVQCLFEGFVVSSAFQNIYNVNREIVGVEALARPMLNGKPCSPLQILDLAKQQGEQVYLDRLLRAMHLRNFARLPNRTAKLFLNHDIEALIESMDNLSTRALYQRRIIELGLKEIDIVVEILEHEASCEDRLILSSRDRRISENELLALDDVTDSDLVRRRCAEIQPDILKMDISVLAYRNYGEFVNSLRQPNQLIVQEGIETEAEYELARKHCDYLQGYYLHMPQLTSHFLSN